MNHNKENFHKSYYKIKDIKVFGSKENFYHNLKKYRKVYDESECRYIYCEFSFYNKLFDESDWEANAKFVCTRVESGEQICELKRTIFISMERNIMYIREGWGTPEPGWWKPGAYKWDVFFNDEFVGSSEFHITQIGPVTEEENPYFEIASIRLFESTKEGLPANERVYLKTFSSLNTRYINAEVTLDDINTDEGALPLEVQFNFFNDIGQHKAFMSYFTLYDDESGILTFDTGFGANNGGYWYEGKYSLEMVFMDQLVAVVNFEVGEEETSNDDTLNFSIDNKKQHQFDIDKQEVPTFEEATEELDHLIGLRAVKSQINDLAIYLKFLKIRKEKGLEKDQPFNLNTIFSGNPGTGKTTVAKMLGKIYYSLGLLSHGKILEVGRAELVGEFIGQTAPKVKKIIEKARGGILFIDEAYSLTNRGDDGKDFGKEVIEVLIKEMSDGQGDLAIVFAGYPKEMENFLNSNPGLSSRIRNIIYFPDYSPEELMKIADHAAHKRDVNLSREAKSNLKKELIGLYRVRDEKFGNARFVNAVIEEAKQNMALRLMHKMDPNKDFNPEMLSTIADKDIKKVFVNKNENGVTLPIDEELLHDALTQLHDLVGLDNIKCEVDEMVKLVRYYKEIDKDIRNKFSIHTVFTGNAGTGKTTVARLLVQIYKALGILERGQLIEVDRKELVAGFIGQTAEKTSDLVKKALGGGLFIDEAYALSNGGANDFGKEAIVTLLKMMEDHRGEFMVIVAGYPHEMKTFLEANPGLMSRFDKQFKFNDYDVEELILIAKMMLDKEELRLNEEAEEYLKEKITTLLENKENYFGNARVIRKIVTESIKKQNLRMADTDSENRDWLLIHTITLEDIASTNILSNKTETRRYIGFQQG